MDRRSLCDALTDGDADGPHAAVFESSPCRFLDYSTRARARDSGDDDDDDDNDDSDSVDKGNETSRSRSTENARSRSLKFFLHAKFLAIIFGFNTCPEFSL
jgi:hypothetical protein